MSQINVNNIRAKDGVGPVGFPGGINATGVVTATSFSGPLTGNVTGNVTGNTSGTAGGLTGTPNITVGTVTGTDATFSGNLTVNGTTTTIDTAVTAVDSLAVDGNVAIGTVTAGRHLTVSGGASEGAIQITNNTSGHTAANGFELIHFTSGETQFLNRENGAMRFDTNGTERFRIDQHGTSKFKGPLTEKTHYDNNALTGDYNHDLITHGNVYWSYTAASGAFTFNLRGSATVALNDMMDTGESLSFWFAHACHGTTSHYMTAFKVDGTTISGGNIIWSGGSAPSAAGGGSGTKDVYTFTVFKVGNNSFRAFAAQTNHT